MMKTSLYYDCPQCNQHCEVSLKAIANIKQQPVFNCQQCSADLALSSEARQLVNDRHQAIKKLTPLILLGPFIVILVFLLGSFDLIAGSTKLFGYGLGWIIFIKYFRTKFVATELLVICVAETPAAVNDSPVEQRLT